MCTAPLAPPTGTRRCCRCWQQACRCRRAAPAASWKPQSCPRHRPCPPTCWQGGAAPRRLPAAPAACSRARWRPARCAAYGGLTSTCSPQKMRACRSACRPIPAHPGLPAVPTPPRSRLQDLPLATSRTAGSTAEYTLDPHAGAADDVDTGEAEVELQLELELEQALPEAPAARPAAQPAAEQPQGRARAAAQVPLTPHHNLLFDHAATPTKSSPVAQQRLLTMTVAAQKQQQRRGALGGDSGGAGGGSRQAASHSGGAASSSANPSHSISFGSAGCGSAPRQQQVRGGGGWVQLAVSWVGFASHADACWPPCQPMP